MYSSKEYISTVFSITKLTHAIQFKGNTEEILKKENQLGKRHLQNLPVFQKAYLQRFRATKMCQITSDILSESSQVSLFIYLWVLYINSISSSIEKELAKLFTVLEKMVFKSLEFGEGK